MLSYPWILTMFGGGAAFCDEAGCFGPNGYAFGASFGRAMGDTWSFELEGTYARSDETLPARIDPLFGIFVPELQRTRIWGGGTFMAKFARFGDRNSMFIAISLIGGYEEQKELGPEGVFLSPTRILELKAERRAGQESIGGFQIAGVSVPKHVFILLPMIFRASVIQPVL